MVAVSGKLRFLKKKKRKRKDGDQMMLWLNRLTEAQPKKGLYNLADASIQSDCNMNQNKLQMKAVKINKLLHKSISEITFIHSGKNVFFVV